jgi:hypothetical protein
MEGNVLNYDILGLKEMLLEVASIILRNDHTLSQGIHHRLGVLLGDER